MLSNYGPPLLRKGVQGLPSVAELQWGVNNEVGATTRLPCTPAALEQINTAQMQLKRGREIVAGANVASIAAGAADGRPTSLN